MSPALLAVILGTVTLSAFAQLALKMGAVRPAIVAAFDAGFVPAFAAVLQSPLIWLGLCIYAVSVGLWLWVLTRVELSVAYPFVGVSFVVTMIFGGVFLGENVAIARIAGTLLIAIGCALVARSG